MSTGVFLIQGLRPVGDPDDGEGFGACAGAGFAAALVGAFCGFMTPPSVCGLIVKELIPY
jgi:hypothetical protein